MTPPPYELRFRPAALRQLRKLDGQSAEGGITVPGATLQLIMM